VITSVLRAFVEKRKVNRGLIMLKKSLSFALLIFVFVSIARAQTAEVTIQLNEQFFDALLAAIFKDAKPLEFPISQQSPKSQVPSPKSLAVLSFTGGDVEIANRKSHIENCNESIRLLPEVDGVKTAVRFRDGRIFAPIAFAGKYNPPLVGCVDFSGVAETNIELEFDKTKQTLIGRAKVQNVNLSGTGGIGGGLIARLVQNSIDKKINPLNILEMDRVSFVVPVQTAGNLRMKAVGMRHEVTNGALNVYIAYQFSKAE
jgi:hypothetical protein